MKRKSIGYYYPVAFFSMVVGLNIFFFNRLSDPPYWDALTGIYTQGVWLARHDFNYLLLSTLPHYGAGGPHIQFFSLFALLFGGLIKFFPPALTFLILHQLIFLLASGTILLSFLILKKE